MRPSFVTWALWLASPVASRLIDYRSVVSQPSPRRIHPRSDDTWDHIVKGTDVVEKIGASSSIGKSIANFRLRAKATDPSVLGVDTVKQLSGYLDNDAEDKHLFYCK